jgi:hypothetical protein
VDKWRSKTSSVKRQINNLIVQPKYWGCEGGCLQCVLEPIGADFVVKFYASKARSLKQTSQRAVRQSSLRAIY